MIKASLSNFKGFVMYSISLVCWWLLVALQRSLVLLLSYEPKDQLTTRVGRAPLCNTKPPPRVKPQNPD